MRSLLLRGQQFIHGNIFPPWTPTALGSSLALWLDADDASSLTFNTPFPSTFSAQFDGSGDYLSIPSDSAFQFGTGDFTVESWINMPAGTALTSYWRSFLSVASDSAGGNSGVTLYIGDGANGSTVPGEVCAIVGANAIRIGSGQDIRGLGWVHVALTRTGTTLRLFVNGALTVTNSNSSNINATVYGAQIGLSILSQNNFFIGSVSNVRVVKGTSVYTSAFQPPSAPLTAISGTSLLTLQSSTFIDNSPNNFTITKFGDTSINSGTVSQWRDKSGNGRHADQATAANQPAYVTNAVNGRPKINYDSNDSFTISSYAGWANTGFTVISLVNLDNATIPAFPGIISENNLTTAGYFVVGSDNSASRKIAISRTGQATFSSTLDFPRNVWGIVGYQSTSGITGGSVTVTPYLNSTSATDMTLGSMLTNSTSTQIGASRSQIQDFFNGSMAEIIVLSNSASTADRQRLEGYLAHKWGTTANLPGTHPYRFAAPTTIS